MKNATVTIAVAAIILGFVCLAVVWLDRTETATCIKWQEQASEYPGFYLTQWQKQQCDYHGITIEAPVR